MTTVSYLGDFFSTYHSGTSSRESAEAARKGGFRDSIGNLVGLGYVFAASGRSDIKVLKRFGGTSDKPRVKTSHFVYEQERALPFALHSQTNSPLETLFDPGVLAAIYRSAFKIHFAAMCRLEPSLVRRPSDDASGIITSQSTVPVFKTNRRWCRGTQAGLFTAAIPAIFMLLLGKDRRCYLDGEPNSLASALGMVFPAKENTFGYNALFSYLPTLLGIIAGPLLTTLGSYYSMFGPYMPLRHAHAKSERSLSVDYDNPLHTFKSFALCVALSGVFYPMTTPSSIIVPSTSLGEPIVKSDFGSKIDFMDVHYVLAGIISGTIKRLTWTTDNLYLLPFSLPNISEIEAVSATTLGFKPAPTARMFLLRKS
ncbi:hypothetical protein P167DRAFT_579648 [Morchella conica CCBAS932]|uniref:Uncharacterized protein n=1 Tax=Morchella conica CCBAS932 TaxID=1392247 RepID=A0A3N4KCM2_9PEZI|nr:hypothetical protein P167DRAFT_579648 [Morchella conica CCBAS932]